MEDSKDLKTAEENDSKTVDNLSTSLADTSINSQATENSTESANQPNTNASSEQNTVSDKEVEVEIAEEQDPGLFERLIDAFIRAKVATNIEENGYVVVDNALGSELSKSLREEMVEMQASGNMLPNQVRFLSVRDGQKELTVSKPHIYEADLHQQSIRENLKKTTGFQMMFEEGSSKLVQALQAVGYNRDIVGGSKGVAIKMQYNSGSGGCFPLHYDNPGRPNRRQLTCVVYLNPDWKEGDGGEIELVPFLKPPVRVRPLMGRMVIFRSDAMLHRVRPSNAPRYCFTAWIDGKQVNADNEVMLRLPKDALTRIPEVADALLRSPIQRLLARAVYEEEFVDSLQLCMGRSGESEEMMASHVHHMNATKRNPALAELVRRLRAHRDEGALEPVIM